MKKVTDSGTLDQRGLLTQGQGPKAKKTRTDFLNLKPQMMKYRQEPEETPKSMKHSCLKLQPGGIPKLMRMSTNLYKKPHAKK